MSSVRVARTPRARSASAKRPIFSKAAVWAPAGPCRATALARPASALPGGVATMTAIAAVLALQSPALAGPTGGTVVQGSAGISQAGNTTNINQSSNKAIIDWQRFSIASQETVNFNQPSSSAVTLNRVIGNEQSVISGALNANGQVFIVNSAGVLFSKGSQVNVGGLVASTLDISNTNFMAGNYVFSGSSTASVVNQGAINAHDGGYVALLGKTVSNEGAISATLGTVAMASGQKVTLNFAGDSLIDVTIDDGVLNALVENKAAIKADGGRVILTAKAADAVLSAQVNNSGIIQARTMAALTGGGAARTGSIKLLASGGTTHVAGTLDASAPKGGKGGKIETSGNKVTVAGDAIVTTKAASGQNGTWLIDPDGFTIAAHGGDITGAQLGTELASSNVTIASTSGNSATDGNLNVNDAVSWSSGNMLTLDATNAINVNAPVTGKGALALNAGTDININMPSAFALNTVTAIAGNNVNINGSQNWTAAGSWTFTGANINVDAAVNWSAGALAFNAANNINVNSPVNWSSGALTLAAGANIFVNKVMTATGTGSLIASYGSGVNADGSPNGLYMSLANPGAYAGRIDFSGTGSVTLEGQNYTVINSVAELDAVGTAPSSNYVLGSSLANLSFGDVLPFGFSSLDQFTGNFNGFGHSLTLSPLPAISITSPLSIAALKDTNLVLTSSGDININAPVTSGAGLLTFNAANNINLNASVSDLGDNTGSFAFVAGNNIPVGQSPSVTGADIFIDGPVSWSAGTLTLNAARNIYVNAAMTATDTASFDANYGSGTNLDGSPMGLNMAFGTDANGVGNGTFAGKLDFSGSGTLTINNNAYTLITSWDQLTAISDVAGYFALASNLTAPSTALSGAAIAELGNTLNIRFHPPVKTPATLDGLGHTISGLTINDTAGNGTNGLIGTVDAGGAVRNIGVVNVNITDKQGGWFDGGLIGVNYGTISYDFATGTVTGSSNATAMGGNAGNGVGGLIGLNQDKGQGGDINYSYAHVIVNGSGDDYGGLVGWNQGGSVNNSYASGDVTGNAIVGGLVGFSTNLFPSTDPRANGTLVPTAGYGDISNSFATGNVTGTGGPGSSGQVGGLVGSTAGDVSYSFATGDVKGEGEVGGLVGNGGNISYSYATGNVSTNDNTGGAVGGLVGQDVGNISYSYATGSVTAGNTIGGLAGSYFGNIGYSYATGNVTADGVPDALDAFDPSMNLKHFPHGGPGGDAGGLVGVGGGGSVSYSYATGNVTAPGDYVGGLVGEGSIVTNSYATGNVTGRDFVGGLAGMIGSVANSNAKGSVSGVDGVGGAVGYAGGIVDNVIAYGDVSGRNAVGGLAGWTIGDSYGPVSVTNSAAHGNVTAIGLYGGALLGYIAGYTNTNTDVNVTGNTATGSVTRDGKLCKPSASDSCMIGYNPSGNLGDTSGNTYFPPVITSPGSTQQTDAQTAAAQAAQAAETAAAGAQAATVAATTGTAMAAAGAPSAAQSTAGTTAVASLGGPQIDDNIRIETPAPPPAAKAETPTNRAPSEEQLQRRRVAATTTARKAHAGSGGANFGATIRSIEIDGQRFDLQGGGAKPDAAKDGASGAKAQ